MRPRAFFLVVSLLFGVVAVGGMAHTLMHPGEHDGAILLAAGLASVLFAGVAWVESPSPRDPCPACGGRKLKALGFCASCGITLDPSAGRR
jgi:hypothetical protein